MCGDFCLKEEVADTINNEIHNLVIELDKMLENALALANFDRELHCKRYGEELVGFVEKQSEFWGEPEHHIQNSLNIAYDKGFVDCVQMVQRVISKYCADEVATS